MHSFAPGGQVVSLFFLTVILATLHSLIGTSRAESQKARMDILPEQEWAAVDDAVQRALTWLANNQQRDGSFPTLPTGQPAVTSLCVLAMLSVADLPGQGTRGEPLSEAIDFVLRQQKPNGWIAQIASAGSPITRGTSGNMPKTISYNHCISGLMLTEAYSLTDQKSTKKMQRAIEQALQVTLLEQRRPKPRKDDHGGWRYLGANDVAGSDLSVIGWHLMFLRSAKNAGFDVPDKAITDAVACVRRHYWPEHRSFIYEIGNPATNTRAMTGAGILALAHAGLHNTPEAIQAGETLRRYRFDQYNQATELLDRYHYSLFMCCQAAYQVGGECWSEFFPPTARALLRHQNRDGSWAPESSDWGDHIYGNSYTTALVVLALGASNQLLPIFQR